MAKDAGNSLITGDTIKHFVSTPTMNEAVKEAYLFKANALLDRHENTLKKVNLFFQVHKSSFESKPASSIYNVNDFRR
jgi:hypothetical protein